MNNQPKLFRLFLQRSLTTYYVQRFLTYKRIQIAKKMKRIQDYLKIHFTCPTRTNYLLAHEKINKRFSQ